MIDKNFINEIKKIVGREFVHTLPEELACYSYDSGVESISPVMVVRPGTTEEVSKIVKIISQKNISIIPRGAGTNLCGATVPVKDCVVISTERMRKIIELDRPNLTAIVQAGVITFSLHKEAGKFDLFYPPDPGSMKVSTIGGNVAENAGGPHCFKYGVTKDYVLGLTVVLANGDIIKTGGKTMKNVSGYNLTQLFVGSEGTLGIITEIILKLIPLPKSKRTIISSFLKLEDAMKTVSTIVSLGIVPSTLEIMDDLTIKTVEDYKHLGLPLDVEALLLIEVDGDEELVAKEVRFIEEVCKKCNGKGVRAAKNNIESEALWEARRSAYPSLSRAKPVVISEDIVVPRTKLVEVMKGIKEISKKYKIPIATFGHAGDGNLHPNLLADENNENLENAIEEMFKLAISLGGTITGEHGIGKLKSRFLNLEFKQEEINLMKQIKDTLDPNKILNPGKIF